ILTIERIGTRIKQRANPSYKTRQRKEAHNFAPVVIVKKAARKNCKCIARSKKCSHYCQPEPCEVARRADAYQDSQYQNGAHHRLQIAFPCYSQNRIPGLTMK